MKYVPFFALLTLIGCADSSVNIKNELRARLDEMEAAYEHHNNQAIADIYTDDSYLIGPEGIIASGRKEVDTYWKRGRSKQIRWTLEDFVHFSNLDDLLASDAYNNLSRKPPLWDDLGIELSEDHTYYYQVGRSTLVSGNNQDRGGSVVNFLLVWTEKEGKYYILIDSYVGTT